MQQLDVNLPLPRSIGCLTESVWPSGQQSYMVEGVPALFFLQTREIGLRSYEVDRAH